MIAIKLITLYPDRVLSGTIGGMGWFREGSGLQRIWKRLPVRDDSRTPGECVRSIGALAVTQEQIEAVKLPMVILVGDRDPVRRLYVTPLEEVRKDWPVIVIEGAGHINCIAKEQFKSEVIKTVAGKGE